MDLSFALKKSLTRLQSAKKKAQTNLDPSKGSFVLKEQSFFDPVFIQIFDNLSLAHRLENPHEPAAGQVLSLVSNRCVLLFEGILTLKELTQLQQLHFQYRAGMLFAEIELLLEKAEGVIDTLSGDPLLQAQLLIGELKKILAQTADFGHQAKAETFELLAVPRMRLLQTILSMPG